MMTARAEWESRFEIPGRVTFLEGRGELPMIEVRTAWSAAEIYLHGAHVTHFRKKDEPPLLFLSQCSRFSDAHPIRGGIPIIFPWFGAREGMEYQHGFARLKAWQLREIAPAADGSVRLHFRLPDCTEASAFPPFTLDYLVTVDQALTLELTVTNRSTEDEFSFENCLHTYFAVGDIGAVSLTGLKGLSYLDKVANFTRMTETSDAISINSEVDRIYLDTTGVVEVLDSKLGRRTRVEKEGSASTVVWNPWTTKAQQMPDFGNDEYQQMLCVESGNVDGNKITLPPGKSTTLKVRLSSGPLA